MPPKLIAPGSPKTPVPVSIKANSIQMMAEVKGLIGTSHLIFQAGDFSLKVDARAFPFCQVGDTVLVVLSCVRIGANEESQILPGIPGEFN